MNKFVVHECDWQKVRGSSQYSNVRYKKIPNFCIVQRKGHLREGVDHGCYGGLLTRAHIVEVQHALHGAGLHAPHDGLRVLAEQSGGFHYRD